MIVMNLPCPPSANRIWRKGRGRVYRSEAYNKWTANVGWELKVIRAKPIKGRVRIEIAVSEKSRIDLDNHGKPTIDALVTHGIIEGDSKKTVRSIALKWDATVKGIQVTVAPTL
jgi:Holliday junction resolvase RusA-like endonuclease